MHKPQALARAALLGAVLLMATPRANAATHFGKTDVFASAPAFMHATPDGLRYDDRAGGFRLQDDVSGGYRAEGTVTSDSLHYGFGFDTVVPSWNADCPMGTWVKMELSASDDAEKTWSAWYEIAAWGDRALTDVMPAASKVKEDAGGRVNEDTLELKAPATRLRFRVTLHTDRPQVTPVLTLVAVAVLDRRTNLPMDATPGPAWGREVAADYRSQLVANADISGRICGPTSTTMALTAHGIRLPTAFVAQTAWDKLNNIYGNWPFLAAAASELMRENADAMPVEQGKKKLAHAYVLWPAGWKAVEQEILNGNPCVVSINFKKDELHHSPIHETDGHLILVRGFTKSGDVIVNDPASHTEAGGRVVYSRQELDAARHGGPAIVIHPYGEGSSGGSRQ